MVAKLFLNPIPLLCCELFVVLLSFSSLLLLLSFKNKNKKLQPLSLKLSFVSLFVFLCILYGFVQPQQVLFSNFFLCCSSNYVFFSSFFFFFSFLFLSLFPFIFFSLFVCLERFFLSLSALFFNLPCSCVLAFFFFFLRDIFGGLLLLNSFSACFSFVYTLVRRSGHPRKRKKENLQIQYFQHAELTAPVLFLLLLFLLLPLLCLLDACYLYV